MTNRFSKWSRHSSRIVWLLSLCGLMYACKDEFILDDEKPSWLSSSVYSSLEQKGNFRTYLRLLADKDVNPEGIRPLTDVLNQTGSKTVFVADDDAWDAFFAANASLPENNPWHYATSYENLSPSQKKLLIHTSMLNNAIVMENLASSQSSGTSSPTRGEYMRRYTDVGVMDSITKLESKDLPFSYSPFEKDYWERFREENGGHGIYMATDSTPSMMLHFTSEHMTRNIITDEDFARFMGRPRNTGDVHIYNALLKEKDGVCENGYVNVTEKPLCPLANMAEAIRTNGKTRIFSHILDRFSAPFYSELITKAYKTLHPSFTDSIFTKRYFSKNNFSTKAGYTNSTFEPGPKGTYQNYDPYKYSDAARRNDIPCLKFDPGWNGYYDEVDVRKDMAAMFVPSDKEMWRYFQGAGEDLIRTYYCHEGVVNDLLPQIPFARATTEDELFRQIDGIPIGVLGKLVENLMQRSFVQSVPSKWAKLTDDAMEELFGDDDLDLVRSLIDTCLLCSNGVVYVMDMTPVPATYRCVAAPAYLSETNKVMQQAIFSGSGGDFSDFMKLNYYAYLKAMRSKFSLFLPSDSALAYYYDPASMKSRVPRVGQFEIQKGSIPIKMTFCNYYCPYNKDKGEVGTIGAKVIGSNGKVEDAEVINRLKDILESHTIVHDETNPMTWELQEFFGNKDKSVLDEYFLSKNGNAVKVEREMRENDEGELVPTVVAVKGGFQLENERLGLDSETPGVTKCEVSKWRYGHDTGNGDTYILRAPLVPTYRSVYSIFTNDADRHKLPDDGFGGDTPYTEFYNLCKSGGYDEEIIGCGLIDRKTIKNDTQKKSALKKFQIFFDDNGLDYNVQFFNNYRYTVFVPSNEAVLDAIEHGLPTWEEIYEDYHSHCKPEIDEETGEPELNDGEIVYTNELATLEDSVRIAAKITYLINFVRYHFADNSVFVDKTKLEPNEMITSSYDKKLELFCKIHVDRIANGDGTELRVCDDVTWKNNGNSMGSNPLKTIGENNVLARDISCNSSPADQMMKDKVIQSSSAAVIHSIDGYLNHKEVIDGDHSKTWESTIEARKYLQRYAIR